MPLGLNSWLGQQQVGRGSTSKVCLGVMGAVLQWWLLQYTRGVSCTAGLSLDVATANNPDAVVSHLVAAIAAACVMQHGLSEVVGRLMKDIPATSAWHVLALLQPWPLPPGQQLCWEGEPAEYIWLLQVREAAVCGLEAVGGQVVAALSCFYCGRGSGFATSSWTAVGPPHNKNSGH
jgi:hypothetical protein